MATVMMIVPTGPSTVSKAAKVNGAPSRPESHRPVTTITKEVTVQIHIVPTKTSNAPHNPCFTGCCVLAEA